MLKERTIVDVTIINAPSSILTEAAGSQPREPPRRKGIKEGSF